MIHIGMILVMHIVVLHLHKRFDLLYYYPQDQVLFVESPLTMLSFAILPIKTARYYQYFNLMNLPDNDLRSVNLNSHFEGYYSDLEQVLPGKDVFDKPFIDDIISCNLKKHQDVLNIENIQPFQLPKITVNPKTFVRKLFDTYPQNP